MNNNITHKKVIYSDFSDAGIDCLFELSEAINRLYKRRMVGKTGTVWIEVDDPKKRAKRRRKTPLTRE